MKHKYIYNTSDVGYMDEEWINYIPENSTENEYKVDEKIKKQDEQKELEKVQ
jgi:hypothetical protein